jgi:hypothetical protein
MNVPATPGSMAEHWDLLWYLVVVLMAGGIIETLRRLMNIERKQDEATKTHNQCRLTLLSKQDFKDWKENDFKKWQEGRDGPEGLWHAINSHSHQGLDEKSKVVKT